MKKFSILAVAAAFIFHFSSCSNDEQLNDNSSLVESEALVITTDVSASALKSTKATISNFSSGATLGLFVTSGSLGDLYDGITANENVYTSFSGTAWEHPRIRLTNANATIFAYSPYNALAGDGKHIPIDHLNQCDYMYGTHSVGQAAVNKNNPTVNLTMNHAMALLQFRIHKTNYPWKGALSRIEVANAPGKKILYSEGTINIETGIITPIPDKNQATFISSTEQPLLLIPDLLATNEKDFVELMVLPIGSSAGEGDVVIHFTIDDRIYTWKVPALTHWLNGSKNTYTVTISGTSLQIGDVIISDWTDGVNGNLDIIY